MTTAIPQDFFPQRVRLLMSYNPSLTLSEQSVAGAPNQGQLSPNQTAKGEKSEEKFFEIETPDGKVMEVPIGTKINRYADPQYIKSLDSSKSIMALKDKRKGGEGNPTTDEWVPSIDEWSRIIEPKSVVRFTTPQGLTYRAVYSHPTMDRLGKSSPDAVDFYSKLGKLNPEPSKWQFNGYFEIKTNKKYLTPDKPWYEDAWEIIKNNWRTILYVIITLIVGVLTSGLSLSVQAAIFFALDVIYGTLEYLRTGDEIGTGIILLVGLIPVVGRYAKYGVKDVSKFLAEWGPQLSKVKSEIEFKTLFKKMREPEKLLMTRAFRQTPGELKKAAGKLAFQSIKKAITSKQIQLSKIPFKQLLWIKQVFIEGGAQLTTGIGLQIAYTYWKYQEGMKMLEKEGIKLNHDEKTKATLEEIEKRLDKPIPEPTPEELQRIARILQTGETEEPQQEQNPFRN